MEQLEKLQKSLQKIQSDNHTKQDELALWQDFISLVNSGNPNKNKVKKNKFTGIEYLPIAEVEMLLDVLFAGRWETKNFQWNQVFNELVGSIELEVNNPITGERLIRTGAAAVQIQLDKGAKPSDLEKKKPNALEMGAPKLKAMCVGNAAKSLGKRFGRDLSRQENPQFNGIYEPVN